MNDKRFCPSCGRMVAYQPAHRGNSESCKRCGGIVLFDSREDYFEHEREWLEEFRRCDHDYAREDRKGNESCLDCGLGREETPEDAVDERVLDHIDT